MRLVDDDVAIVAHHRRADLDQIHTVHSAIGMSALGTKRTCRPRRAMSAFSGETDVEYLLRQVSF
jgi:hypothetical protein